MKLQELFEASVDVKESNIINFIKTDCQPFLKICKQLNLKQSPIFRGIKSQSDFLYKTVRLDDRKPKDLSDDDHDLVNKIFTKEYGHPYRNGLFVTTSAIEAEKYANLFFIFPKGEFSCLWNPNIIDLYISLDNSISGKTRDATLKDLHNYSGNFTNYIKESPNTECMIWCKEYYAISTEKVYEYDMDLTELFE